MRPLAYWQLAAALLALPLVGCGEASRSPTKNEVEFSKNSSASVRNTGQGSQSGDAEIPSELRSLVKRAEVEDEQCRGGSGDAPETLKACNRRYAMMVELERRDWCWGGGEASYQDRWLRCSTDPNYRPGQLGTEFPYSEQDIQDAANISAR